MSTIRIFIISDKEIMFSVALVCLFACLSVINITQKSDK